LRAARQGDFSIRLPADGVAHDVLDEIAHAFNGLVEQNHALVAELDRVHAAVAHEGNTRERVLLPAASGAWSSAGSAINSLIAHLSWPIEEAAATIEAIAEGNLSREMPLRGDGRTLRGDLLVLGTAVKTLVSRLRTMSDNVREVAAVSTAIANGDLSQTITIDAPGAMLALKNAINQMIANLRDTTRKNQEQDWLKTNLAKFFSLMQGQRNLQSLADQIMSELTPVVGAQHGAFYIRTPGEDRLELISTYAYTRRKTLANRFAFGEGLVGQCALERKPIIVTDVPQDYVQISSGLGQARPLNLAVYPVLYEDQLFGVIELGTFHELTSTQLAFLEQLMLSIGLALNLIGTYARTEKLLQQLQGSNTELERRRRELEEYARQLEDRNREIAKASTSLEAKSQELARVSQYKSQFLTTMSHEIRTPLNSVLILAQMLAANEDKTLSPKQQEWAGTIHASGRDLLALINQILDLSKVEAGKIEAHPEPYAIADLEQYVERTFRPVSAQRNLGFSIELAADTPAFVTADHQLVQQILRNLLANAFKFTERGRVTLRISRAAPGTRYRAPQLQSATAVIAFAVSDTGIGVPEGQQERIFDAFQQADASITRKYGGTGLGLAISREYARVLGGELALDSTPGSGSTFTLYLPLTQHDLVPDPLLVPPKGQALPPAPPPEPRHVTSSETRLPPLDAKAALDRQQTRALTDRSVLVVEDDPRNLFATTTLLERLKINVIPASNAREAYAKLEDNPAIDLVLMDIMMPEIDGYQATREIRRMKGRERIPIIALTAKASAADRDRCLDAGCNDYVSKPADVRQLVSVMAKHLGPKDR
jgi:signal transduction histidine kinase/ActR/RegA family two-component response regulator